MRFRAARETVKSGAIFKANRRTGVAREIDDLLNTSAAQTFGDEDTLQRTLRAQSFNYGVKSNENGQARLSRSRRTQRRFVFRLNVQAVVETVGKVGQRDNERQFRHLFLAEMLLQVLASIEVIGAGAGHFARVVEGSLFGEGEILVRLAFEVFDVVFGEARFAAAFQMRGGAVVAFVDVGDREVNHLLQLAIESARAHDGAV